MTLLETILGFMKALGYIVCDVKITYYGANPRQVAVHLTEVDIEVYSTIQHGLKS